MKALCGITLFVVALAIVGNLFSSLKPKALAVEGKGSSRILFTDNVLVDSPADGDRLEKSVVERNLSH